MQLSIFLAKVWGIFLVILCLSVLLNRERFLRVAKRAVNETSIFVSGMIALMIGIPHILIHNIWTPDWRGLITFLGWITVVKGIVRLFFPEKLLNFVQKGSYKSVFIYGVSILLLLGLYLTYIGFR